MVNSLKNPTDRFNILNYVEIQNSNTRSSDKVTLKHVRSCTHQQQHFYFNRIPRLWNKMPSIDLKLTAKTIKTKVYKVLWSNFMDNFNSDNVCTFHFLCPCGRCSKLPCTQSYWLHSLFSNYCLVDSHLVNWLDQFSLQHTHIFTSLSPILVLSIIVCVLRNHNIIIIIIIILALHTHAHHPG